MAAKEPGRETSGDGISAFMVCQPPPLHEALEVAPDDLLSGSHAVIAGEPSRVMHVAAWRKRSQVMTGEVLRRPTVGRLNV